MSEESVEKIPAAAKKPADRKAPAKKAVKAPVTAEVEASDSENVTVTIQGVDLLVPKGVLNDFELMEHIMAVDMGDPHSIIHAGQGLRKILGLEQYETVMASLRDEKTGRAEISKVLEFFVKLIEAVLPNF